MAAYQQLSDEQLASLIRLGDSGAFKEIFERFYDLLFIHAYKRLNDEDDAKDVVQELFEAIWVKREQLLISGTVAAYLYSSVRNRIINFIDHKKVESRYMDSLSDFIDRESYCADFRIREKQLSQLIEREIDALPVKMRQIFILSRKENLSHKEIAEKLNISEQTVKTQVKNALRTIRPKISTIVFFSLLFRF